MNDLKPDGSSPLNVHYRELHKAPSAVLVPTGLLLILVHCLGVYSGNHKDKFHEIHISLLAEIYC